MSDENKTEIEEVLSEIKTSVDKKFADTALKADVDAAIEKAVAGKVSNEEVEELKASLEALEAKLDAIPSPAVRTTKETPIMNVNELFTKNAVESGKTEANLVLKNITATTDVNGAPTDTYGITGSSFAANPFRALASNIETNSKALVLPVRTGAHGAAAANTTNRGDVTGSTVDVSEVTIMVTTIEAQSKVTVEAADDLIGFDNFFAQDIIDEIASKEAAAHVTTVEGMAGVTGSSNSAVTLEDLAELHFAVGPQYRANGSFVVSTDVMKALRTINTASTGGDLVFDAQLGAFRLFGRPIYENAYMADISGGAVVGSFGDFKKGMVIANRSAASVGRYAETAPGYYTYYGNLRSGAAQWHSAAVKTLTMAA